VEDDCCAGLNCIHAQCGTCSGDYPTFCPISGSCWSEGVNCETVTSCGGTYKACKSALLKVDCATDKCVCKNSDYPVYCAATSEATDGCWTPGTDCSTVTMCNGEKKACHSGYSFNCATGNCVSNGGSGGSGGSGGCTYDSECGYSKICKYGSCITPECTHDSDCYGCNRCSDNNCVACFVGPYGCTCK
jgi:hypothetical protein